MPDQRGLYVGGARTPPSTDDRLDIASPHTEAVMASRLELESTSGVPRP